MVELEKSNAATDAIYSTHAQHIIHVGLVLVAVLIALAGCQPIEPFVADAGADFEVAVGAAPRFDGCASTGKPVNYRWVIGTAPEGMAEYDGKVIKEIEPVCAFVLEASMLSDEVGEWLIELTTTSRWGDVGRDTLVVRVVP